MKNQFSIHTKTNEWLTVTGKPIIVTDYIQTFIHKDDKVKSWIITELRTGALIAMGDIQKKALERAREILTIAGKEKTLDRIEEFVAKYGEAPPVDNSVLTPVKEVV